MPSRSKRCVPRRADDVAHRRTALTGVNEYPNLAEPPLPHGDSTFTLERYAAGFEKLRDRSDAYLEKSGARPPVLLLPLGPLAEHNIRATFAANLLASGGIEAVNPGTVTAAGVAGAVSAGRRFPHGRGRLRYRCPLRDRCLGRRRVGPRCGAVADLSGRPAEGGGRCRRGRPPRRLPDR